MAKKKINVLELRHGFPDNYNIGYLNELYIGVAKKKMRIIKKGDFIYGIYGNTKNEAKMYADDWAENNEVPKSNVKIIKAYYISYK